jgi:cobyrinic acid a,c-diamide synthase
MAALRRRGRIVASAKVGPDFIDPGYHELATGRPGRNLCPYLCGESAMAPLAARAAAGADLLVIEGVMGLFDGVGATMQASTAEVAALLEAPVVLVVDASAMSGSVGALVHGFHDSLQRFRGEGLAGLVLNRVGSDVHESILREALEPTGLAVLGVLRRHDALHWRDRHLGLIPVVEQTATLARSIDRLATVVHDALDLGAVERLAGQAPSMTAPNLPPAARVTEGVPIGVLGGKAFSFVYPDNLSRLAEAGATLVPIDPLSDESLPERIAGLYAGGGFPEVFAETLSANEALRHDVARRARDGLVVWAECGGLLWLARSLEGHPGCGVVPADARMTERVEVGYRQAAVLRDTPLAPGGSVLRGHVHHYSTLEPSGDALVLDGRAGQRTEGWGTSALLASYLHVHLGADPAPAERFVAAAAEHQALHGLRAAPGAN